MSNQCVQAASRWCWREKRQTAPRMPPCSGLGGLASLPHRQQAEQCALTSWPLLIIAGLLAPSGSPQRPR